MLIPMPSVRLVVLTASPAVRQAHAQSVMQITSFMTINVCPLALVVLSLLTHYVKVAQLAVCPAPVLPPVHNALWATISMLQLVSQPAQVEHLLAPALALPAVPTVMFALLQRHVALAQVDSIFMMRLVLQTAQ